MYTKVNGTELYCPIIKMCVRVRVYVLLLTIQLYNTYKIYNRNVIVFDTSRMLCHTSESKEKL